MHQKEKPKPEKPGSALSLSQAAPQLVRQWHPTKNSDLDPNKLTIGSRRRVWWKCPNGPDHEWQTSIANRTNSTAPTHCPYCSNQRVSVTNSLASRFPQVAAQWHPTRNGTLTPTDLIAGSNKVVWWKCSNGPDHEWQANLNNRTRPKQPSGCPCCAGKQVSITNSLATHSPELAKQWHPTLNAKLTPAGVAARSKQQVWWQCPANPDHQWQATVANRTNPNYPRGCPYCANKKVSPTNSLASLFPQIAAQWHPTKNSTLTPDQIVAGSHKQVWWQCPNGPDHQWQISVYTRTSAKDPGGCPCCSGKQVSVTNSLARRYPELAKQWHPTKNGVVTPDQVLPHSHLHVWWQCSLDQQHVWLASIGNRTNKYHQTGCPFCANQPGTTAFSPHHLPQPKRSALRARLSKRLPPPAPSSPQAVATDRAKPNRPSRQNRSTLPS